MKRIALFAVLAALAAAPAWAQSKKATEEKATAPLNVDVKADAKAEAKTEDIKPVYRHLTKRSYLDARECLKKKSNEDIIICAEKFL